MAAIGYTQARNLMRQLDWKARVSIVKDNLMSFELYHPSRPNSYRVRLDSARKLLLECRFVKQLDVDTSVYCYNSDGSDETRI